MRKKRWLTAGMAVIAAAAVIMAATSYNEIRKKLNMQCENQKTMLVAGYELQTENTEKETTAKSGAPVVKLRKTKSVIQAGEGFDASYQVESITDDKDERSFLFGQIQISGDYSTDEPGTYTLTYTAMDSDGNVSAPVTLELVVKG